MFKGILHLHITSVVIFLLIYFIKTLLLLIGADDALENFRRKVKVGEMIVSVLFLLTGIYLWANSGNTGAWLYVKVIAVFASIPLAVIGFKKKNKMLAAISFFLLVYAYGVAETKSPIFKKAKPEDVAIPAADSDPATMGAGIYTANCAKCHGEDGKLGLSGATDLSLSQLDQEAVHTMINTGKGAMPAFAGTLNEVQVKAVSDYILTLRK